MPILDLVLTQIYTEMASLTSMNYSNNWNIVVYDVGSRE